MFNKLKIRTKILIVLSSVAILAAGINGYVSYDTATASLKVESFNKLTAVREMKANQIEDYFQHVIDQVLSFSEDQTVINAMIEFKKGYHSIASELNITDSKMDELESRLKDFYRTIYLLRLNRNLYQNASVEDYWPSSREARLLQELYFTSRSDSDESARVEKQADTSCTYRKVHEEYHPVLYRYMEELGCYDIFLVDHKTGHIVYTVSKEADYGTSLIDGPYHTTNLAEVCQAAQAATRKNFFKIVDFSPYPPSYNAFASFIASPIYNGDQQVGVLIFQIPTDRINDIMTNKQEWAKVGRGKSGEAYIVGEDYTLRNQSRFLIEDRANYFTLIQKIGTPAETIEKIRNFNSTIGLQQVQTEGTEAALRGETGTGIFPDYRGVPVFSSYKPLDIPDMKWAIMSEVDKAEALAPVYTLRKRLLLLFVGLIVVIVTVAIFFSKTITRPLHDLQEHAKELAKGNMSVDIETGGSDEIGDLARSFVVMQDSVKQLVGDLRAYGEQLEDRIAERTAELEKANERSRLLLESTREGIFGVDTQGVVTFINSAAAELLGYEQNDVLGQEVHSLIHHSHGDGSPYPVDQCPMNHAFTAGKAGYVNDEVLWHKEGKCFDVEYTSVPMKKNGEIVGAVVVFRDITERKKAEEELRNLSSAVTQSPSTVVITDVKGNIEYVNPKFTQVTGYTYEEAMGQNPRVLKSESLPPEFYRDLWDTISSGNEWRGEFCNRKKNGEIYWEMASISPIRNAAGEITHYVAVKEDVTERKQMEESLRASEERFDLTVRGSGDGLWDHNPATGELWYAERFRELLGYSGEEEYPNVVESWSDGLHPDDKKATLDAFAAHLERDVPYDVEYRLKTKSGEYRWFRARGISLRDENGRSYRAAGSITDLTDQKQAEEEIHLAREAAEEANRTKSKFLANMSHELRTPMNAIIGYSEMLMEEAEDLEQEEFVPDLKKIHGAGKHLLALINDILDLSKIEAGKMDLFLEEFNIEHMLDEINSTVDTLVKKKNNQFVLDYTRPLGDMHTDLTKVRQSLFNLISNAAKFTENGTVTLSVKREFVDNQDWIEFRVSDTGIGIAEDKLGILFEEFTQADDSTTRNFGGTGLGLAITKRFCEMMGGTISVESQLGKGSTFIICLPLAVSSSAEKEDISEVLTEEATSSPAELSSESSTVEAAANLILVIDDDPNMLDMMTKFLKKEEYQVVTASSGDEGLRLAKELHPAAITLDVLMPQVDGWKVLKTLKSDPETRNIPVIMLTVVGDKSMGLSLGATECLSKPIDRDHLFQILNRCCPSKSGKPILVVEDDTTMRELLSRTLVKEGWKVREAANGKVALEQVRREVPGMILLDLLMPVMDGFTFLRELRKESNWRDIPVLVITSKDITREEKQLLEERVVTILQKGAYKREELLEQVNSAIKQFIPQEDHKQN